MRKQLGNGSIISKLTYFIEATTCCSRSVFGAPAEVLNRCAGLWTGEWRRDETKNLYTTLGWLTLAIQDL